MNFHLASDGTDLVLKKVEQLETTLKTFRAEFDVKMCIVQQILANRNEQLVIQKKLLEKENTLYETLMGHWGDSISIPELSASNGLIGQLSTATTVDPVRDMSPYHLDSTSEVSDIIDIDINSDTSFNNGKGMGKEVSFVTGDGGTSGGPKSGNAKNPCRTYYETKNDHEESLIAELKQETCEILSMLTPENVETLVERFLKLKFKKAVADSGSEANNENTTEVTARRIGAVIDEVFRNCGYLRDLRLAASCAKLLQLFYLQSSPVTSNIFRKELQDQCEMTIQQEDVDDETLKLLDEKLQKAPDDKKEKINIEIEDKKTSARQRSLANVRFVTELYKVGMLTPRPICDFVNRLIRAGDDECLECVCQILTTLGQKLENHITETVKVAKENPSASGKWTPDLEFMQSTIDQLKELSSGDSLPFRIRTAIIDVCELRDAGWKSRRYVPPVRRQSQKYANAPLAHEGVLLRDDLSQAQERRKTFIHPSFNFRNAPAPRQPMGGCVGPIKRPEWSSDLSNKASRFNTQHRKFTGDRVNTSSRVGPSVVFAKPNTYFH